ncbi:MAG: hypothetical protein V1908_03620 [Candidatus Peregrinibacteria bacterium]
MTKSKKPTKQTKPSAAKAIPAKPTAAPSEVFHKAVHGIFGKIQTKTGLSNEKIDQFQKEWMALPATRRKYEHLTDAPMVALEEGVAMANDILDYLEGQEGGKSLVFKSLKEEAHELVTHPVDYFKTRFDRAKSFVEHIKETIQAEAKEAKKQTSSAKSDKSKK